MIRFDKEAMEIDAKLKELDRFSMGWETDKQWENVMSRRYHSYFLLNQSKNSRYILLSRTYYLTYFP